MTCTNLLHFAFFFFTRFINYNMDVSVYNYGYDFADLSFGQ